jgi:hypothetical protein
MDEVYKKLTSVFKIPGDGAPLAEVKFRIPDPKLDEALDALVADGTLSKYEFPQGSGMWHFKLKKKISIGSEGGAGEINANNNYGASSQQLKELSDIVEEIAKEIGDDMILNKFNQYKSKYL